MLKFLLFLEPYEEYGELCLKSKAQLGSKSSRLTYKILRDSPPMTFVLYVPYPVAGSDSSCFPGYPNWLRSSRFFMAVSTGPCCHN